MNNMKIATKEDKITMKYVDVSDTYCIYAEYDRKTHNVLYRVRPVVKHNGKRYVIGTILKERYFEKVYSFEHALDLLDDRISDTIVDIDVDRDILNLSWHKYGLKCSVCIDHKNNKIEIFGVDNHIYKDIESVYVHMDELDAVDKGKCNALFINSVDITESYEKEITVKELI